MFLAFIASAMITITAKEQYLLKMLYSSFHLKPFTDPYLILDTVIKKASLYHLKVKKTKTQDYYFSKGAEIERDRE